jgi:outer membrane murein-binding lipoprotein Lpp
MKFSIILTLMLLAGCSSTASDPRLTTNERCERSTGSHFCR